MQTFRVVIVLDTQILSSSDCLVLSRKVNGVFSYPFIVGNLSNDSSQLLQTNVFAWNNEYQLFALADYTDKNNGFVLAASNAVKVKPGGAVKFEANKLVARSPVNLDTFSVEGLPMGFSIVVQQAISGGCTEEAARFRSIGQVPSSLSKFTHIQLADSYILSWVSHPAPKVLSSIELKDGFEFQMPMPKEECTEVVKWIRYGFTIPDKPSPDELPRFTELLDVDQETSHVLTLAEHLNFKLPYPTTHVAET